MNVFPRSDAISTLDSYSFIIVLHLALIDFFPDNEASNHWKSELNAFRKILFKVANGKKGRQNLYSHLVEAYLKDHLVFREDEEKFELYIEAKGMSLEDTIDWDIVRKSIKTFSSEFSKGDS